MDRQVDQIENRIVDVPSETVVWRYQSLEKFVPLLSNQMYFPRPTQFDDKWEGMYPPSYLRRIRKNFTGHPDDSLIDEHMLTRRELHRHAHFVSCWHMSQHESDAMWRLYGLAPSGVAIQSTVGDLVKCFRPDGQGAVQYYDPSVDQRTRNMFSGPHDLLWKRQDFSYEQEFRIWFNDEDLTNAFDESGAVPSNLPCEGRLFQFSDAESLIRRIVLAPFASEYFKEILCAVLCQSNKSWLCNRIQQSSSEKLWEDVANGDSPEAAK